MANIFIGTRANPYHLSVGAVVRNARGDVLCHYFQSLEIDGQKIDKLHLLIRETLEPGETIEAALTRGLMEEVGVIAKPVRFLGSIQSVFPIENTPVEKTTLYFECELIEFNKSLRSLDDPESASELVFLAIDDLIGKMETQGKQFKRTDLDEAVILKRIR